MPVPTSIAARKNWMTAINEDKGAGLRKSLIASFPNIEVAAGTTDMYLMAPEDGVLHSVEFSGIDAIAASDTNYVTFSVVNLGQNGLGTTVMSSTSDANTTKATGGTALVANGRRVIQLSPTLAALNVLAGDRIRVRATVTGTLPNTENGGVVLARFNP